MKYREENVITAFTLYTKLAKDGYTDKDTLQQYFVNEDVRSLIERFAHEVDCVIVHTSAYLYMIPETKHSAFHVSNEWLKRNYLRSDAVNADIYLLYFATIVLFGCFFDRYHSQEQTLQFIRLADWVKEINERIDYISAHEEEVLTAAEQEFSYNWKAIIDKWQALDDVKETAKKQSGNTISRLSFVDTVKRFLIDQELIEEIGNDEITITEKAKIIIQRYFMDAQYNNNIFEFMYEEGGNQNAGNQ